MNSLTKVIPKLMPIKVVVIQIVIRDHSQELFKPGARTNTIIYSSLATE